MKMGFALLMMQAQVDGWTDYYFASDMTKSSWVYRLKHLRQQILWEHLIIYVRQSSFLISDCGGDNVVD